MREDGVSPCGLIRVEWGVSTGRMSHEIWSPRFLDAATGRPFLSFWDDSWDGAVDWRGEGRFALKLRNYNRRGALEVLVDHPARTFVLLPDGAPRPLASGDREIRRAFERRARMRPDGTVPPAWGKIVFFTTLALLLAAPVLALAAALLGLA